MAHSGIQTTNMTTADYILAGNPSITYQPAESTEKTILAIGGAVHQRLEQENDGDYNVYSTVFTIASNSTTGIAQPTISDTLLSAGFRWGVIGIESDDYSGLHTLMCERKTLITRHRN